MSVAQFLPADYKPRKICKGCWKVKPITSFPFIHGKTYKKYRRSICYSCEEKRKRKRNPKRKEYIQRKRKRAREDRGETALKTARRHCRKRGIECDLTSLFVARILKQGCKYCGEKELLMTLDRIDNTKSYTKDNVNPSCIRCNLARRDMPYKAWEFLLSGLAAAREAGAFGDWLGGFRVAKG
jgi:hypothetical protein